MINVSDMSAETTGKILEVCADMLAGGSEGLDRLAVLVKECENTKDFGVRWRLEACWTKTLLAKTEELYARLTRLREGEGTLYDKQKALIEQSEQVIDEQVVAINNLFTLIGHYKRAMKGTTGNIN